jgi:RsiW-degrading membrane proteinase PrsW (M82 family)
MRCDHCGKEGPDGVFCTNCGAHQGTAEHGNPKRRHHRYAAHPGEHVLSPGVFTTIFPHLGHRKIHEFRWIFIGGLAFVFALYFAGLITAALCVAVMLVPSLYLLYLYEAQVYKEEPVPVILSVAIASVGIGIGVTLGTNDLIPASAKFSISITGGALAIIAVAIPLIQEAAKPLAVIGLRVRPKFRDETMDGLVFGIAAGLGFGVGESFVRLSSIITDLPVRTDPGSWVYPLITTAVFLPLLQATCTGIVCATIWRFARGSVDVLAMLGIVVAVGGHIAFTLFSQLFINHGWSQLIVLLLQASVDLALLVYMRIVLHYALLEEAAEYGQSEKYCAHCHMNVLAAGFCPVCGMALSAVPYHTRQPRSAAATPVGGEV